MIARGNVVLLSVTEAVDGLVSTFGVYRSTNSGATFYQISSPSGQPGALPYGRAHVLIGDPTNLSVLYAVLLARGGGTNGVYKSSDLGVTWSRVSTAVIDNLLPGCGDGVRMSATISNVVYIGISDSNNGGIVHAFRSTDGAADWTDLGLARTSEASPATVQVSYVAMALFANPGNTNIVYAGGGDDLRCDLSQPVAGQWARMNGCVSGFPPNDGNINCTGPHVNSRNMIFDLNGNLILVCDGGIYRRNSPANYLGGWSSMIGNLQVGEYHNIAYDPVFQLCMAGSQDCGTQRQVSPGQPLWVEMNGSDGGDVTVDSTSVPGRSIVYASDEFFNLVRKTYDSSLGVVTSVIPRLTVIGGGAALQPQFNTPIKLNSINPQRLVIAAANGLYESFDQGETVSEIGPGITTGSGLAYGGYLEGVSNPDILYVASSSGATGVFVRTNAGGALTRTPAPYPGTTPIDVALVLNNYQTFFVIDSESVFASTNLGLSWSNITGNLVGVGQLRCVRTGPTNQPPSVLVGTDLGVYVSAAPNLGFWSEVGTNLPNAPVFDMEYNQQADLLLAGTLGRGAWIIANASSHVFAAAPPLIRAQPRSQSVLIGATANFTVWVGGTAPFGYQWLKDGVAIPGASSSTLLVAVAQPTDNGDYSVVVSNALGSFTSSAATLTVTGSATANCAVCAPGGLVSWWTADGTASDRVGINHGTLRNGTTYTTGFIGEAFSMDGVATFVDIPNSPSLTFSSNVPYTLEARVFRASNQLPFHILGKRDPSNPNFYQMGYDASNPFVPTNVWTHLADTFDGSTYRRYYNGILVQSIAVTIPTSPTPSADLEIGASGPYHGFQGLIDEVRIYDRALSASEIRAIYAAGTNGMCPPTPLMFTGTPNYSNTDGYVLDASLRSGQPYRIQATTNLATTSWIVLTNFTAGTAPIFSFTNNRATNVPYQFYRIVSP